MSSTLTTRSCTACTRSTLSMPAFHVSSHCLTTYSKVSKGPRPVQPAILVKMDTVTKMTKITAPIIVPMTPSAAPSVDGIKGLTRPTYRYGQFTLPLNQKSLSLMGTAGFDLLKDKYGIQEVHFPKSVEHAMHVSYLQSSLHAVKDCQDKFGNRPRGMDAIETALDSLLVSYPDGLNSVPSHDALMCAQLIENYVEKMDDEFQNMFEDAVGHFSKMDNQSYYPIPDELLHDLNHKVDVKKQDDTEGHDDSNYEIEGDNYDEVYENGENEEYGSHDRDESEEHLPPLASTRCSGTCIVTSTANNTHFSIRWNNAHAKRQHDIDSIYQSSPNAASNAQTGDSKTDSQHVSGSTGLCGFKGTKRGTPHAAETIAYTLARKVKGMCRYQPHFHLILSGTGRGRSVVLKSLISGGMNITVVSDGTPFAHNGCRNKKPRRI